MSANSQRLVCGIIMTDHRRTPMYQKSWELLYKKQANMVILPLLDPKEEVKITTYLHSIHNSLE